MRGIFVTGTDTHVGKTVTSAILVRALRAFYWKPVQCGDLDDSDTHKVRQLSEAPRECFYPERFRFKEAQSPHRAAATEHIQISLSDFPCPLASERPWIVEGAGGGLVPLNNKDYIIDLALKFELPVLIVTRNYLGGLNHTLMTVEVLRARKISLLGLVFNGRRDALSENFLSMRTGLPLLFRIGEEAVLDAQSIAKYVSCARDAVFRFGFGGKHQ